MNDTVSHEKALHLAGIASLGIEVAALQGCRFASFTYKDKKAGELARHVLNLHVNVQRCYRQDLQRLYEQKDEVESAYRLVEKPLPENGKSGKPTNQTIMAAEKAYNSIPEVAKFLALSELITSFENSLTFGIGNNPAYTKKDIYIPLCEGIRINTNDKTLEIMGFQISKKIIEPGNWPDVKSSAKTIFKNQIRSSLLMGKFRTFSLDYGNMKLARINGEQIYFE